MKVITKGIGLIILAVFSVAVIALMALMNFETLGRIYPTDPMKQVWGLVLFTGGTLSWFATLLWGSRGFQRPLAAVLFGLSLLGEIVYAAADTFMGGQNWVAVNPNMGMYVLWTFIGMTFAHGLGLYMHFFFMPEVQTQIEMESLEDDAQNKSLARAQEKMTGMLEGVADQLSQRTVNAALSNLRLPILPDLIIDAKSVDVNDLRPAQKATADAKRDYSAPIPLPRSAPMSDIPSRIGAAAAAVRKAVAVHPGLFPRDTPYTLADFRSLLSDQADAIFSWIEYSKNAQWAYETLKEYLPKDLSYLNFCALYAEIVTPKESALPASAVRAPAGASGYLRFMFNDMRSDSLMPYAVNDTGCLVAVDYAGANALIAQARNMLPDLQSAYTAWNIEYRTGLDLARYKVVSLTEAVDALKQLQAQSGDSKGWLEQRSALPKESALSADAAFPGKKETT